MNALIKKTLVAGILTLLVITGCSRNPLSKDDYDNQPSLAKPTTPVNNTISYSGTLIDVSYDGVNTTYTYSFTSNPDGGPAISHIVLSIPEEWGEDILVSSSDPLVEWVSPDPTTGVTGIKFDTGYNDEETRTVTVTLAGVYETGTIDVAIKSGNGYTTGTIEGPVSRNVVSNVTLSGTVYYDINGNGNQDVDEPGINEITVSVSDNGDIVTSGNGSYSVQVYPGNYSVSVTLPSGLTGTTPSTVQTNVTSTGAVVNFGATIDLNYITGKTADGYTIGYWKTNISKALSGKTQGIQVSRSVLENYLAAINNFALSPYNTSSLTDAYNDLSATGSNPVLLLKKQLLASEFNYQSGAYIGGNKLYTNLLLYYGEYLIVNSANYTSDVILKAKDIYDAYNNSHGEPIPAI